MNKQKGVERMKVEVESGKEDEGMKGWIDT
jgi:hypothetical protein